MYNPNGRSVGTRITNEYLPRVEDKISFLYIDKAKIVQDKFSIVVYKEGNKYIVPLGLVNVLLLGPGVTVSHMAVKNIGDAGCTAIWCGENLGYVYAVG